MDPLKTLRRLWQIETNLSHACNSIIANGMDYIIPSLVYDEGPTYYAHFLCIIVSTGSLFDLGSLGIISLTNRLNY